MLNQIVEMVNNIRKEYPIIGNELDGKIYYMNGNDGTDFDWKCNERTCEFMVFHENEMGYIKLCVNNDNSVNAYVYADGGMLPNAEIKTKFIGDVKVLAMMLYETFDKHGLWDETIEEHLDCIWSGRIPFEFEEYDDDDWDEEEDW